MNHHMRASLHFLALAFVAALAALPLQAQQLFANATDTVPRRVDELYQRGLDYLVRTQMETGTWADGYASQPGVVGLAILAMLAHGDDPNYGPYQVPISRGLDFILKQQNPVNGYIGQTMYNHGFATLALAESYGQVHDPRLGPALARAVKLLLSSQARNPMGAWRYSPESGDADTTVSGACLVALYAARNAGIAVPDSSLRKALEFYRLCQCSDGGFGYTNASGSSAPRGAIGTLVFALAREQQSRTWKEAYSYLCTTGPGSDQGHYFYYLYYASQAMFRGPEEGWHTWNAANIQTLASIQNADGSWPSNNGPTFGTATGLLSLALNYRFLPIYER